MLIISRNIFAIACLSLFACFAQAQIINLDFTGRFIIAAFPSDEIVLNNGSTYTDISASMTYNTLTHTGSSDLSVTVDDFLGSSVTFHDIFFNGEDYGEGTEDFDYDANKLMEGVVLVDGFGLTDMEMKIFWNAKGFINAIDFGLQAGDVLSGSAWFHDGNGNGIQDGMEFGYNIGSVTPVSDSFTGEIPHVSAGTAPIASIGAGGLEPLVGTSDDIRAYFDLGTGNSMHITSVSPVPVPASIWLFGTGLLGLIGMARRKA